MADSCHCEGVRPEAISRGYGASAGDCFAARARPIDERFMIMKTQRVKIDPTSRTGIPAGHVDRRRLDETTDEDILRHQKADDAESMQPRPVCPACAQAARAHPVGVLAADRCAARHHPQLGTRQTSPNRRSQGAAQGAGQGPRGRSVCSGLTHRD